MKYIPLIPIAFGIASERDTSGIYGGIYSYAFILALVGAAFLAFIYFWSKGRLDMDEEPKMQMMRENEEDNNG
jgi:hypothetical protein